MGRSSKAIRNVATGLVNKLLMLVLAFVTRTIYIRRLGAVYTGVSSLYSNILSVLALAELGIGNVLMFYLYSALKDNDREKIRQLVYEFKRIYRVIIISVLGVGVLLIPFLPLIIHSSLDMKDLVIFYLLYLANSVASYFVMYRTMVISADQNSYIANIVQTLTTVAMYVLQTVYLLLFKDFLGYLLIQVFCTIANNVILNAVAIRRYPYLKEPVKGHTELIDRRDLFLNIKATFLFKVSDTILDQTDSIIISIMFGTIFVGYYSNYYILVYYLVAIAAIIANGLVAGFGNLNAEGDMERSYQMFRVALMCFAMFGTWCTTCYACVVQDVLPIWIGAEYVMDHSIVIAVLAVFYLRMATNTVWMYRSSMGLFKEVQYINLAAAGLNIVASVLLGKLMGVAGVVIATAVSRAVTSFWYEGKVVFDRFRRPVSCYLLLQLKNLVICCLCVGSALLICSHIGIGGFGGILIKLVIASVITLVLELGAYFRTEELHILLQKVTGLLHR